MPKKNRRDQQHLRQQPSRRRSYSLGSTAPKDVYKPGFPMNLLGNIKAFSIIGAGIAIIMVVGGFLTTQRRDTGDGDVPTVPATPSASVTADASASATVNPKSFEKAEQVIDAQNKEYTATVKTSLGSFDLKLYADKAPNTVNSFVFLAQKGFFDGITFHRVIPNFVVQAGDPTGRGSGGPGYATAEEPNELSNKRGTVSMAKAGDAKEFGSQFFINLKDNTSLDYTNPGNKYYPFAEVTSGMEVVDAISKVKVDSSDKPVDPVTIQSVTINEKAK